ncbi:DUF6279 family lipoprotein [Paraferrimonas sedimenticola]|uniref:Lipoprotein n=1 Tax=Paraferrimonas sedimenticola TaxID=375674 RepID=A0AA37RWM3_9GAMM|nr:DUF6279 family lipoprotein [Paraferrimonas sedimenticola]GLP96443.1 hypothetical protein GCM10007895_17490 [Paraferrimonas sedimenticola]
MKGLRWLVLLAVVTMAGCSSVKMGYYFADWAIEWELEDYVDLDREQKKQLDKEIDALLVWHQREEMPKYRDQLSKLFDELSSDSMTPEQFQWHLDQLAVYWKTILVQTTPALNRLLPTLSDDQVDQLITNLKERQQKGIKEREKLTPEERLEKSQKGWRKSLKKNLGSVQTAQMERITLYLKQINDTYRTRKIYQAAWTDEFAQVLSRRGEGETFELELTTLLENPESLRSEDLQAELDENRVMLLDLLVDIHKDLSDKQRKRMLRKLGSMRDDVADLAAKA